MTSNNLECKGFQRLSGRAPVDQPVVAPDGWFLARLVHVVPPDEERVIHLISHSRMGISTGKAAFQMMGNLPEQGDTHRNVEPDNEVRKCEQPFGPPL